MNITSFCLPEINSTLVYKSRSVNRGERWLATVAMFVKTDSSTNQCWLCVTIILSHLSTAIVDTATAYLKSLSVDMELTKEVSNRFTTIELLLIEGVNYYSENGNLILSEIDYGYIIELHSRLLENIQSLSEVNGLDWRGWSLEAGEIINLRDNPYINFSEVDNWYNYT